MKNMTRAVGVLLLSLLAFALAGCGATDEFIKVGDEQIPSLYSVVGERKISGVASGVENGVRYNEKTYASGGVSYEDIEAYWTALTEKEGFAITMDTQTGGTRLTTQLAKEASAAGDIIIIDIQFDEAGSTVIRYQVGEGTLSLY